MRAGESEAQREHLERQGACPIRHLKRAIGRHAKKSGQVAIPRYASHDPRKTHA
jgi:hypothetical protein